ncbi:CUB and sushi domain-containing protein 3 [Holothuria leucospilota]|uniref:CUB and sushi domain-containing protein 3 n=1 Tax=Holothuria leucospilota TaxID=206669 RepID=A0A9Q1C5Z0_HOLLE|nr:CUB and sushi domain-containing protein 3 [Holothuria leucospilota]
MMLRSLRIVMEFSHFTSIPRLSVVQFVIAFILYLSFCDAVSQNGVRPGTCIGNGGYDDSCPTGMYCDNNIGGTCLNCSICYEKSFFAKHIPIKCQCDSSVTGSSAICESIRASEQIGSPIESERDVNRLIPNNTFNDFKGYFDGSAARSLRCPEPTTSSSELTTYGLPTPYLPTPLVEDISHDDISTAVGYPEQCMDPGDPLNGYKKYANYTKGGTIEFACNKSYSLKGKKSIYCIEGGKWSDEIPTCHKVKEPVSCKDPGSPTNGFQILKGYHLHGIVMFACNQAYRLEGPNRIQCTAEGWSDSVPQCIKTWKGKIMWMIPLFAFVLFVVTVVLVTIYCRHKVRNGSVICTPNHSSDAENPPSDARDCDEDPSENYCMLPAESSESNSEETAGSSSSGTVSGSGTPEHTSAVYLTDESSDEPLASSSIQQSMRMDSVCLSSITSCSEELTEVAWSAMHSSLQTLLEDKEFRKVFLRQLFSDTILSEDMLNILCSLTDEMSVQGVREQAEIHDKNSYRTMASTLTDSSLRSDYPAKREHMDELVQLLNGAHKSCDTCNGASQLSPDNSTAV